MTQRPSRGSDDPVSCSNQISFSPLLPNTPQVSRQSYSGVPRLSLQEYDAIRSSTRLAPFAYAESGSGTGLYPSAGKIPLPNCSSTRPDRGITGIFVTDDRIQQPTALNCCHLDPANGVTVDKNDTPKNIYVRIEMGGTAEQILPLEIAKKEHPQLLISYLLSQALIR
eukprot:Tbor_TRINITY_DN3772_c0_g1::TRINITY_DN3772_c0_g1_i1::g.2438::m.2438